MPKVTLIGSATKILIYIPFWFLRLDGRNRTVTAMLAVMGGLNILLDVVFLIGMNMGVFGAALASVIATALACILGFRHIAVLTPEAHDEMIGFLSQLTHCIAVALMDCKDSEHLVEYTGDSFRDLTRIARINENMWTELFLENRDELLSQMDLFLEKFTQLRDALAKGDEDTMKEMMRLSSYRRSFFDKK